MTHAPHPRHVVVTGAGGLIGREVLDHLRARGIGSTALVRHDPGDLRADRVVVGDAGNPDTVREAMCHADGVVHLAALAAPTLGTAEEVFTVNTAATVAVLEQAGLAGIATVAVAGSINALGLNFSPVPVEPPYLPLDADTPTRAADGYSMSKWADEATARAMHRRHGTTITVLRYPMVGGVDADGRPDERTRKYVEPRRVDPGRGRGDVWSYLSTHDAARAALLALTPRVPGVHVAFVAAPRTYLATPTTELLDVYLPGVPRRRELAGTQVPLDLSVAADVFGFTAERELSDLPDA
jgi:nucleoside-diphosphate-sugar epimerase